jgi:RNA polymerase sigma-70 factor (ECF subfamily)
MTSFLNTLLRSYASDEEAWRAFYDQYLPRVFHFMCYKVGNVQIAEDLTATTFEKAWRNKSQFKKSKGTVQSWLFGIARHVVADHFRKPDREEDSEALDKLNSNPSLVEDKVQKRQEFEEIFQIISTFKAEHQELIALKYGAGLNNREIASLTGLSETNVGTILHRLVSKIRKELGVEHE